MRADKEQEKEVDNMVIKTKNVKYFGYHQGYVVYINNVKYPKEKGAFYATNDIQKAIKSAIREKKTGKKQYH